MNEQPIIKVPSPAVMDRAIATYGKEYQIDRFIEETSELTKALLKRRRKDLPTERFDKEKIDDNVQEEIADVLVTLAQVIKICGDEGKIRQVMATKVARLSKELKEKGVM